MESSTLGSFHKVSDSFVKAVESLGLPRLSPVFSQLSEVDLHSALVSHRVLKNYEVPDARNALLRKQLSVEEVINADRLGWDAFNYATLPPEKRRDFLFAKDWLRGFFRGFQHRYGVRFPSNETFVSSRGQTDLINKLRDLRQWQVSPDLVDYSVNIILRNRSLRAVVKQRYREKYGERGRQILENLRLRHILAYPEGHIEQLRKEMVRFMFRAVTTLNRTSRVTTVPKDNNRDRVITCESLWTMICQLSFAASIRDHMKSRLGVDLDTLQNVHRSLIRSGAATIDLSKASDRNYMVVLKQLFPSRIYKTLEIMRTGIFESVVDGEVSYHPLRMFAPMGCGCTFEVMTLTLLAHCRVLDPGSSVFGDDIIINREMAPRLISNLESFGWLINVNKSFVDGPFRESCGGFCDLRSNSFLLSYDFPRPETLSDCYIFAHKALKVGASLSPGPLRSLFVKLYADLVQLMPRDSWDVIGARALSPHVGLSDYLFYVPSDLFECGRVRRHTKVSLAIGKQWQREIRITMRHGFKRPTRRLHNRGADVTLTACFLRRGQSYDLPIKVFRPTVVPTDAFAGVALRDVEIMST